MADRPTARVLALLLIHTSPSPAAPPDPPGDLPTPAEMADSLRDVWGEAAKAQPGGPSYEFFKDLLPPLRYVNTEFRHYPIVLCAPAAPVKARWVSNGSGINLRANKKPMWKEFGVPLSFHVGTPPQPFGAEVPRLDGPRYVEGYLPIVQVGYTDGPAVYSQEAFAPVSPSWAAQGAVFVRFSTRDAPGDVLARLGDGADAPIAAEKGTIRDSKGRALVLHDPRWTWDPEGKLLRARLAPGEAATLAVLTQPLAPPLPRFGPSVYDQERQGCLDAWKQWLGRGSELIIPEPLVQDAWRALVVGNFLIASDDRMNYSAGNAYDHLYEGECGDAVRSLMLYGFGDEARRMMKPLLDFNRQATRFHVAGQKLQLLAHYYWVTRDRESLRRWQPTWRPVIDFILNSRQPEHGLLPPDNYAGDISQQVYALNSNANCWRGLRDMSAVLEDLGDVKRAGRLAAEARAFRASILKAVESSEQRDVEPPFIPNALFGVEKAYDRLTATRLGSYYDLMAPYIIGSEVFGPGDRREGWMLDYLRNHGGVAMGMIRSTPHQGEFNNQPGVNVLYGLRYVLTLLRRDEREDALVGFYGQLAQAMTRDTFIGGEGSRFLHGDRYGRSFYLPPNSTSNATFLILLRYLLVQDWDLDDDGHPETLRLLYGCPGRWLDDGRIIEVKRAPSAFGPISFRAASRLHAGELELDVLPPPRAPASFLVRPALPPGWRITSAKAEDKDLPVGPDGAIDLAARRDPISIRIRVEKRPD